MSRSHPNQSNIKMLDVMRRRAANVQATVQMEYNTQHTELDELQERVRQKLALMTRHLSKVCY
jgi:hypothetical protein